MPPTFFVCLWAARLHSIPSPSAVPHMQTTRGAGTVTVHRLQPLRAGAKPTRPMAGVRLAGLLESYQTVHETTTQDRQVGFIGLLTSSLWAYTRKIFSVLWEVGLMGCQSLGPTPRSILMSRILFPRWGRIPPTLILYHFVDTPLGFIAG